jgi:hypothetical protein
MSNSIENTRKRIDQFLEVYSQEQLDYLELLMETAAMPYSSKANFMALCLTEEERRKVDTAVPHDYVKAIQEILPSFETQNYVFNYNDPTPYGAMLNIHEALSKKMMNVLGQENFKE